MSAAATTLATEIHRLPQRARTSVGRARKARTCSSVQPAGVCTPSSSVSSSGYATSHASSAASPMPA